MKKAILATKVGMTQIFNEDGSLIPVTVLQAGPCYVTQIKTVENDGYKAVQVGFVDKKEQTSSEQISEAAKDQEQDMVTNTDMDVDIDTDVDEHSAAEAKEELSLYAQSLSICDLSDLNLIYEKAAAEHYDYFYTQGLKGIPENRQDVYVRVYGILTRTVCRNF